MDAGFRVYRHATDNPRERQVDRFRLVRRIHEECELLHKITGDGGWAIDFHTELDPPDAINLATSLEPLHPYFCEDLTRSEGIDSYATIRETRCLIRHATSAWPTVPSRRFSTTASWRPR